MHKVGFEWLVVLTCVSIYHSIIKDWKTFQKDDLDSFTTLMWKSECAFIVSLYTCISEVHGSNSVCISSHYWVSGQYKTESETDYSHPIPGKKCRLLCWLLWSAVSRKWASKCSTAYLSLVQHSVSLLSIQGTYGHLRFNELNST